MGDFFHSHVSQSITLNLCTPTSVLWVLLMHNPGQYAVGETRHKTISCLAPGHLLVLGNGEQGFDQGCVTPACNRTVLQRSLPNGRVMWGPELTAS